MEWDRKKCWYAMSIRVVAIRTTTTTILSIFVSTFVVVVVATVGVDVDGGVTAVDHLPQLTYLLLFDYLVRTTTILYF